MILSKNKLGGRNRSNPLTTVGGLPLLVSFPVKPLARGPPTGHKVADSLVQMMCDSGMGKGMATIAIKKPLDTLTLLANLPVPVSMCEQVVENALETLAFVNDGKGLARAKAIKRDREGVH